MIKIKTSQLTERLAAAKAKKAAIEEAIPEEVKLVNIDFKVFEVHLENNGGIFIIDLDKTKNYKIKNGYLYKGFFKKIGKIKFIRIKRFILSFSAQDFLWRQRLQISLGAALVWMLLKQMLRSFTV